ncbi:MAG: glycine cleavage system protein H [Bacteroidetes bacterium]|nr:glycine cleavage system protein H [Bacteroidota bacterium]MBU2585559.1 glycine cleavage system protein H [Bacteroidota bacterium]
MESFYYVDIFETKGIEYLLVIGYLIVLIFFWHVLSKPEPSLQRAEIFRQIRGALSQWFSLPEGYYYHQGHAWALPVENNLVKVGIDDFTQKFLGKTDKIHLPAVGEKVKQGEKGWQLNFENKNVDILSPVSGKVVEINNDIINRPELLNLGPYTDGWLMKVKTDRPKSVFKNLLTGKLALSWGENTIDMLQEKMSSTNELGLVMQDGGLPVLGFAKIISPDKWDVLAKEFLMTE